MSDSQRVARLKSRVKAASVEYDEALAFLRAYAETRGVGEQARWFATLSKFPGLSDRLVRAYRDYTAALEGKAARPAG